MYANPIEKKQRRFLRFIVYEIVKSISTTCHNCDPQKRILECLHWNRNRLVVDAVTFAFEIINDYVVCSRILHVLKLDAPSRTLARFPLFHASMHMTNYACNSCINRTCKHGNSLVHQPRFFSKSLPTFKKLRYIRFHFRTINVLRLRFVFLLYM